MNMKNPPKAIHSCIPPEECFGQLLSFSYNPVDKHEWQNLGPLDNPIADWVNYNHKMFDKCKGCIIRCVPELSQLGRLHWHGTLRIINVTQFYMMDIQRLKLHGSFEIDVISDPMVWHRYCYKQEGIMAKYCYTNNVNYEYNSRKYESRSYDSFRRS